MKKKTFIHVNQHVIRSNRKKKECKPVITVKDYKSNQYGHEVIIYDKDGNEAARVKYRPEEPLSCGAHVWIETTNKVEVIVKDENSESTCLIESEKCSSI